MASLNHVLFGFFSSVASMSAFYLISMATKHMLITCQVEKMERLCHKKPLEVSHWNDRVLHLVTVSG